MKTLLLLAGIGVAALSMGLSTQAHACQGAHGYTKTAQLIERSTLSSEKQAALMRVVTQSKADHDTFTTQGDYGKMHAAVQKLAVIKERLGR